MNAINPAQVQGAMASGQPTGTQQGQGQIAGDPFAALLSQLLMGEGMGGENPMMSESGMTGDLFLGAMGKKDTLREEMGSMMAAEMQAGLLGQNWMLTAPTLPENLAGGLARLEASGTPVTADLLQTVAQAVAVPLEEGATQQTGPWQDALLATQSPAAPTTQATQTAYVQAEAPIKPLTGKVAEQDVPQGAQKPAEAPLTILQTPEHESFQVSDLDAQGRFRSAVREAQQLMNNKEDPGKTTVQAVDVEALQTLADRSRTNAPVTDSRLPTPEALDRRDMAAQVKAGIGMNLGKGMSEFVVKLKPEGLGEITVKMVEEGEKITLSILTSSTQTAKLLTNEISSLRETMRPYQVEVREVITVSQPASSAQSTQSDLFGQSFAGHQQNHQTGQQAQPQTYYGPRPGEVAEEGTEQLLANGGLNIYV